MQNTISEQFRWYSKRYKRKGYDLVMQTSLNLSILELLDDLKNYLVCLQSCWLVCLRHFWMESFGKDT